jgi:ubiquitin carboxyl-terminal hydrolase L3
VRRAPGGGVHICLEHELPAPDLSLRIELTRMDGGTSELWLEQGSRVRDLKLEIERRLGKALADQLLYAVDGRLLMNEREVVEGPTIMLVVAAVEQDILLEGLNPGECRSDYMGVYEFVESQVNGCPVYQAQSAQGGKNSFLYKGTHRWMIGDSECMGDASKNNYGYVKTEDDCSRPELITADWSIVNSEGQWDAAAKIKARLCTGAEKMTALYRLQEQEQQARLESLATGAMVLRGEKPSSGDSEGDLCEEHPDAHFNLLLGEYLLHSSKNELGVADAGSVVMLNEHPVYCKRTKDSSFFIYCEFFFSSCVFVRLQIAHLSLVAGSSMGGWWISDEPDFREGKANGWAYNISVTLTPNLVMSEWRLSKEAKKDWLANGFADALLLEVVTKQEVDREKANREEAESRKQWLPLESNPFVMNKYMHKLGLPSTHCFHDVLSFEGWALDMIPKPVIGVLLLYPITQANSKFKQEQEVEMEKSRDELTTRAREEGLFFTKQYVPNACGTIGLVHAVVNAMQTKDIQVAEGVWLDRFVKAVEAGTCAADDIGSMLEDDEELEEAHGEGASEGQSIQPTLVNLHFVAFVHHNGCLIELDGTKKWPVSHGECTPATLLESAVQTVKDKFVALDPTDPHFNLIALAPSTTQTGSPAGADFDSGDKMSTADVGGASTAAWEAAHLTANRFRIWQRMGLPF